MAGTAAVYNGRRSIPSVFLRDLVALWEEFQRRRIQAVSLSGRRRAIGKDMALMAAASRAADLDPAHAVAGVLDLVEMVFIERRIERRPAGARIEFMLR